jgi:ABC-type transport system involved in multi-copper enzyme maturation permease subunit
MHTCAEYTYRTNRQNVIDGLSRNQYITTKLLFIITMALFVTIIMFISAFITGLSSGMAISFEGFRFIFYFFIQAVAYISVAFIFALLLKKSVLSTGIFCVYSLIIENILEKYINKISIGGIEKIGGFLPVSSSEHLLLPDEIKLFLNMVNMGDTHSEYSYLIVSLVYIALCFYACYYRYQKQDL